MLLMRHAAEQFSDEAFTTTWENQGGRWVMVGPRVRVKLSVIEMDRFMSRREIRRFTEADGLSEGWYAPVEAGYERYDSGQCVAWCVVVPAIPPEDR